MKNFQDLRIIFMGTPEFAVASLKALHEAGANIVAVITAPDKPAGRGMKLKGSPVKEAAGVYQIPVLQPEKLKNPEFLEALKQLEADLQIVVAFRMLPEAVWNMPPMGTVNVHGSLLPDYRGAAPINWAIINGEKQTGVTTFRLKHEIDTGDLLMQATLEIGPDEDAGSVHDRMKELGASVLVTTVKGLAAGSLEPKPQAQPRPNTHAPKIFTETCRIDWMQPAQNIHNLVRGLSPFPGAFTVWQGKTLKIYRTGIAEKRLKPGEIEQAGKAIWIGTGDGSLEILELQLEGKKKMPASAFVPGNTLSGHAEL